jgi:hypothetical protein
MEVFYQLLLTSSADAVSRQSTMLHHAAAGGLRLSGYGLAIA